MPFGIDDALFAAIISSLASSAASAATSGGQPPPAPGAQAAEQKTAMTPTALSFAKAPLGPALSNAQTPAPSLPPQASANTYQLPGSTDLSEQLKQLYGYGGY